MYVACRPLTMNSGEVRQPGALVPEAQGWGYSVLRAHLDWDLLRLATPEEMGAVSQEKPAETSKAKKKKSK